MKKADKKKRKRKTTQRTRELITVWIDTDQQGIPRLCLICPACNSELGLSLIYIYNFLATINQTDDKDNDERTQRYIQ